MTLDLIFLLLFIFAFINVAAEMLSDEISPKLNYDDVVSALKRIGVNITQFDEIMSIQKLQSLENQSHAHDSHEGGIHIASFKWDYVKEPLVLCFFFVVIGVFKLSYHHTRFTKKILPESCCLIIIGVIVGFCFIGDTTHESVRFLEFNSKTFFFFLLPPIILESAYSLKDRAFIENIGTILLYAVVGTVLNIILFAAFVLAFMYVGIIPGLSMNVLDIFTFSSLIAAVDPVAVLAVFQEVGVNKMLYFMVFGESLFNDAVTIVCYNLAVEFTRIGSITFFDGVLGLCAFLAVSIGGLVIGLICGVISTIITKFTQDVRVVEPVFLFGMAYLAYMCSELFHFSGIIALIACGLFQTHYACCNISYKSFSGVMYFTKVMSSLSESLIFIVLGVMLVNEREWFWSDWHPAFTVVSVFLCILVRFIVTFSLTYFVNQFTGGVRHISFQEQFIMAYGGLRGAVSFSLAFMLKSDPETKNTMLGATYAVILFTNIIQGSTIKLFVKWLNIRLAKKEEHFRLFIEFNNGMVGHLSQGIETICGFKDASVINRMSEFSKKHIRPILEKNYTVKTNRETKLVELDRACTMREALINSPSQSSFKRQQTIDEMAESGVLPMDFMDDDHHHSSSSSPFRSTREELDQRTEELVKDVTAIRQLMNNPIYEDCYLDRNLTHEEEKENARNQVRSLKFKASTLSSVRRRISIFGKKKSIRRHATQQGLIHSAIATIGVNTFDKDQPSTSYRVSTEDEETGLNMTTTNPEEHPLVTITEGSETSF